MGLLERFDQAEKVGNLHLRGLSDNEIASQLGLPRKEVVALRQDWTDILRREAQSSLQIRDKVTNVLFEVEEHWRKVIKEAWNAVEEADQTGALNSKLQALKLIATINKDKAAAFDRAGATQDDMLVEEMHRTQKNQETLINLLREIKDKHPEVAELIAKRLSSVTDEAEVVSVQQLGDGS